MRIEVDPNSFSRRDPALSVADLPDPAPSIGDRVRAVQPDDDGMVLTHLATVADISTEFGLIYLDVDWSRSTYGVDIDKILAEINPDPRFDLDEGDYSPPGWSVGPELGLHIADAAVRESNRNAPGPPHRLRGDTVTVLDELYEVTARHNLDVTVTADRIPGEPVLGADGRLYRNDTSGDMHVQIDLPAPV